MKIRSITLCNFRCFGDEPTRIDFSESGLTTLIGANAAGKTAALLALSKLFNTQGADGRLRRDDFHIPLNCKPEEISKTSLYIEASICFPEMQNEEDTPAIAETFRHMVLAEEGGELYCRIRLEATWVPGISPEGEIEESTYWITTADDNILDEHKHRLRPQEKRRLQIWYVPATRDPSAQLKNIAGTMLARILRSINWSSNPNDVLTAASTQVQETFLAEQGVQFFHTTIRSNWKTLHDTSVYTHPELRFLSNGAEEIIKQAGMIFSPSESGAEHGVERLSDGQKSLFYLALVATICDFEQDVIRTRTQPPEEGEEEVLPPISYERLDPPLLSILAVEEPENHLAPHFLSRVTALLDRISSCPNVQVIITSHSPAILSRVEPASIRHFRLVSQNGTSLARSIKLPPDKDTAFKYIKEAVRAFPELYFAQLVVLGEGDSEEIVLPRVASSLGVPVATGFVSIAPLGGRYVNHFWRLLNDLAIPHITLLDLDKERYGGGWGRIKYAFEQLLAVGREADGLLTVYKVDGTEHKISLEDLEVMHDWDVHNVELMQPCLDKLEKENVFFSQPLDLDMMMLTTFPGAYQAATLGTGPRFPVSEDERSKKYRTDKNTTLGDKSGPGDTYPPEWDEYFSWYAYLFLRNGKPSTHLWAMSSLDIEEIQTDSPSVLVRLVQRMKAMLGIEEQVDDKGLDLAVAVAAVRGN